jgi:hypothetical protein
MKNLTRQRLDEATVSEHILDMFNRANELEVANGMCWYKVANREARQIQVKSNQGLKLNQICGIIAALSPRNKWLRNLIDAENLAICYDGTLPSLLNFKAATFGSNKLKAILIASMVNPTDSEVLDVLGGDKVRSFYLNILNPDSGIDVTIDGHAISIALGERIVGIAAKGRIYKHIVDMYIEEANRLKIIPNQLQAITWLTYRRLHKIKG